MSALRQLAVGISSLSMVKEFGIARPTMDKYLEKFCKDMVARYAKEYLSPDLKKVVQENKKIHKVPGLLGSLDCTHIYWGQCPTGHTGNYIDRHKRISVILEAVADAQLRFVHFFFGYPGGSNDLNVLQGSPLMEKFVDGSYPRLDYNIAGQSFDAPFILVDGIYPRYSKFAGSISKPLNKRQKIFKAAQEAWRKDVERAFGILKRQWRILGRVVEKRRMSLFSLIVQTCLILHNMNMEDRMFDMVDRDAEVQDSATLKKKEEKI